MRPILVVVRLPQIEREGREGKEGGPHALQEKEEEEEEGRQSQKGATRPKTSLDTFFLAGDSITFFP